MNAPTLLIGLGGVGSKIVERVSGLITPEQRESIAVVVLDTDINDLRAIRERNPFIRTIQTSTRQTVGEYLSKNTYARDTWFPVNKTLNKKPLTEGAGQVRSISRLAFETTVKAGKMEPLHDAIQSLYKVEEEKTEQALRVIITGSVAGGTGSGLILPAAMYVRHYLDAHFRQSTNITRGFFILPEVFFEVIQGETERNNLRANAYATVRELDAFLMKGNGTLPKNYEDSVKMKFPRVAADGYEEYDVSPYDFCFLFDAQNAEGGKLNSFTQYLDHAANCIYALAIGPMNKRSNSSEDNTIRKLAKERGRNRYAGAGSSMLIYPYEDIRTLVALRWAKQSVSQQWLAYDKQYKEICLENEREGIYNREQSLSSYYVNQIDTDSEHDDPFAKAIYKATGDYKNGVVRVGDRWKTYVNALLNKVEADIKKTPSNLASKYDDANGLVNALGTEWKEYPNAYEAEVEYRMMYENYTNAVKKTIAYSLFKGADSVTSSLDKEYKLETYLTANDGSFLHPNAIRYMLIRIKELFVEYLEGTNRAKEQTTNYFDNFEKTTFDDPDTEERVETADDLKNRKRSIADGLSKRPSGEQEEVISKLRDYLGKVVKYNVQTAQIYVLKRGIEYVDSLISAFEIFFRSLEDKVETLDNRINEIYKKYSGSKGMTVRYVCASKNCLDKIYDNMPYTGGGVSIDSDLAKTIYERVHSFIDLEDKTKSNYYFSDLFEDGIIGFFKEDASKNHGNALDIDVIAALEREAEFDGGFENNIADVDRRIEQYVRKVISDTRSLSCPFIETPLGEQQDPINACTFNTSLRPKPGDESPRAQIINSELMNFGGEPDDSIPNYMVMFYKAYYGLRANDLSKFAPPEKTETHSRNGGEYFKAYYQLIRGIHPETYRSREISPHIDRWWHIITKMPDLDEENQNRQEYNIYAAFFWAILRKYIILFDEGTGRRVYKARKTLLKMDDDRLIVSNGTECDKLYEVLDAIAIYPKLGESILADVELRTQDDLEEGVELENGILLSSLSSYKASEPGIGADNVPSESIFDIPMLMKKSSTANGYCEEDVIKILMAELGEIKKYLSRFCSQKELSEVMGKIIMEQFEKHLNSVALESKKHPSIYKESLFIRTCDTIANTLSELGLKKDAQKVSDIANALI